VKQGKLNCLKTGDRRGRWREDGCGINSSRRAGDKISYIYIYNKETELLPERKHIKLLSQKPNG